MTKLRTINWVHLAAVVVVYGFMAGAARFSYGHIVSLFDWLGCSTEEARWAPIFIDGFAFLGWLGRRRRFTVRTRAIGLRLMYGASAVSLVCNVAAGHTWGSRAFGVLVVAGFMVAEWYADHLEPEEVDQAAAAAEAEADRKAAAAIMQAQADAAAAKAAADARAAAAQADADRLAAEAAERAKRSEAGAKAAATRAANRQAEIDRKEAERERRRVARQVKAAELAAIEQSFAAESAPVSPAPYEPQYL